MNEYSVSIEDVNTIEEDNEINISGIYKNEWNISGVYKNDVNISGIIK